MSEKTRSRIETAAENGAVVVKKYANRRLYNTATSSYITLEDLSRMVKDGVDFIVYDAKTGEEITRSVLVQIIFEQEARGESLLPAQFLRQLIRFYGDSMQTMVPSYLEMSLEAFAKQRDVFRERVAEAWGGARAIEAFEDQIRQNMTIYQQAFKMWAPFTPPVGGEGGEPAEAGTASAAGAKRPTVRDADPLETLKAQMTDMQRKLDELSKR